MLVGIECVDSSYEKICSSIVAIAEQSVYGKCEVICIKLSENYKRRLENDLDSISAVKVSYADKHENVKDFLQNKKFDYYGEIKAGDVLHPYTVFFLLKVRKRFCLSIFSLIFLKS